MKDWQKIGLMDIVKEVFAEEFFSSKTGCGNASEETTAGLTQAAAQECFPESLAILAQK